MLAERLFSRRAPRRAAVLLRRAAALRQRTFAYAVSHECAHYFSVGLGRANEQASEQVRE